MRGKKRIVQLIAPVICLVVVFATIHTLDRSVPTMGEPQTIRRIVIDAGHGGKDAGASANSVIEKEVNLAIALKLRDIFLASGFEVVMTREDGNSVEDSVRPGGLSWKKSDMRNRLKAFNKRADSISVSIHQNKYEEEYCKGTQVFYGKKNELSEFLAQNLQDSFASMLQPENTRKIKPAGKDLYLLWNAETPAVMIECGFLSNREEAKLLSTDEYQNKVAFAAYAGIMYFLQANG